MGCGYSVASERDDIVFKYKGPSVKGSKIVKCFPDRENGLLFRVIDRSRGGEERWAFYNDTKEFEFHVRYFFGPDSEIAPLGNSTMSEMENGQFLVEVIVYPLETQVFMVGRPDGFRAKLEALPLSDRYRREKAKEKYLEKS